MLIRAVAIVNAKKPHPASLAADISAFLNAKGISCGIFEYGRDNAANLFDSCDFAITLGGDGTVLFAARYCAPKGIPVFPVNLGEFGFIAGIKPDQWKGALESYLEGAASSTWRMLLRVEVSRGEKTVYNSLALNDFSILSCGRAKIVEFDVSFGDGMHEYSLGLFKADGIIAATPTGSTAYSAAAGGPILSPDVPAIVLSPVCAFSLSSRPIVLPASGKILINFSGTQNKGGGLLSVDGQECFALQSGDKIIIEKAERPVQLIGCPTEVFYNALRYKLNWAGAPVARSPLDGAKE